MASLDAALEAKKDSLQKAQSKFQASSLRLVADPTISVSAIQDALTAFLKYKQDKKLWPLLCPPPGGPVSFSWHTKPHGCWLVKVSGLLFDLVKVSPNTKLQSTKVVRALKAMEQNRDVDLTVANCGLDDMIDKCDQTIRILLSMVRSLKANYTQKMHVYRLLPRNDQIRLDLILDRVNLPPELMGKEALDDEEMNPGTLSAETCTALVPVMDAPKPHPQRGSSSNADFVNDVFKKILGKGSEGSDELDLPAPLANVEPVLPGLSDDSLVGDALMYVPPQAASKEKAKKFETKKIKKTQIKKKSGNAKKKKKTTSKNNASKVVKKEKAKPTPSDSLLTPAPKKKSKSKKPKVEVKEISLENHVPESQKQFVFQSAVYGKCKMEVYTAKSYVRRLDESSGKWTNIIGCCMVDVHGSVCRKLVPHIAAGKSISELYELRKAFMAGPVDVE